jgi:hypothetical protein
MQAGLVSTACDAIEPIRCRLDSSPKMAVFDFDREHTVPSRCSQTLVHVVARPRILAIHYLEHMEDFYRFEFFWPRKKFIFLHCPTQMLWETHRRRNIPLCMSHNIFKNLGICVVGARDIDRELAARVQILTRSRYLIGIFLV